MNKCENNLCKNQTEMRHSGCFEYKSKELETCNIYTRLYPSTTIEEMINEAITETHDSTVGLMSHVDKLKIVLEEMAKRIVALEDK